jgi:hypothetical protein
MENWKCTIDHLSSKSHSISHIKLAQMVTGLKQPRLLFIMISRKATSYWFILMDTQTTFKMMSSLIACRIKFQTPKKPSRVFQRPPTAKPEKLINLVNLNKSTHPLPLGLTRQVIRTLEANKTIFLLLWPNSLQFLIQKNNF